MVEKRSISWNTYIAAFVISVIIFGIGMLLGFQISKAATEGVASQLTELQSQARQMELLFALQTSFPNSSGEFCAFYGTQISKFGEQTAAFGRRLEALEKKRGRESAEVQSLKSEYSMMEMRDFLLVRQSNERCGNDVHTVLYFYTNANCPQCTQQGYALSAVKAKDPSILIYSFDTDLNFAAIDALLGIFKIAKMPAIVVDGRAYEGYRDRDEVLSLITAKS